MKLKYVAIIIFGFLALLFLVVMSLTKNSYENDCLFKKFPDFRSNEKIIHLSDLIHLDSNTTIEKAFPYDKYISSDNWKKINSVRNDLIFLDSINKDPYGNMSVVSIVLTNKMQVWDTENLDSLNLLLNWVERFNIEPISSDKYDILYKSVYGYWLSFISQKLDKINQDDYSIQFNYRFKYLRMRCCEQKFGCGDRNNLFTKAVLNFIESDWGHLISRFWIGTSFLFKAICFFLVVLTLYGYGCIIQKHVIKNKK